MHEPVFSIFRLEAKVHAACLEIFTIGNTRNFKIAPLPRRPDLDVIGLCAGESHVTSAQEDDPVMQTQLLQNAFGVRNHFLVLGIALLRFRDFYQFNFVELMNADHSASADACCSSFATK